ncbi:MAG: tetrahydrofolate dehydrogenase/cyclohydrolase catalytic domain-containing protein, partial [Bacillota bacterium]|nr:tetrahydrofolate dehydrogenase/cyclohydrolase catalytic domain-containing protein [Bacillota bacterium]
MTKLLDGKLIADTILREVGKETEKLESDSPAPRLALLRVGNKADDLYWEKHLKKAAADRHIETETFVFPWDIAKDDLLTNIKSICQREDVHGILPFLPFPLPDYMSWESEIRSLIPAEKDVDCVSLSANAQLYVKGRSPFSPSLAQAVVEVLKYYEIPLENTAVAVVEGDSAAGRALSLLLVEEKAVVTIVLAENQDMAATLQKNHIVISTLSKANFLTSEHISENQIVI